MSKKDKKQKNNEENSMEVKQEVSELELCKQQCEEYLTGWQRSRAEYTNLQKEMVDRLADIRDRTIIDIIQDMLPLMDSFDMAMGNKEVWESIDKNWRIGVEYIYQQAVKVFTNNSVSTIEKIGVPFDPKLHDPMETVVAKKESEKGQVVKIIQKGYQKGDTIIRPAKIVVSE